MGTSRSLRVSKTFDMQSAATSFRFLLAALIALLLTLGSLGPAGFMPAFDRGVVTIVACPGAGSQTAPMHHQKGRKSPHQPCPYASAASSGALWADWAPVLAALVFATALLLGHSFLFVERHSRRERPPLRAPPIPPST